MQPVHFKLRYFRELRLVEALENVCENFRKYKVHKDKNDRERYSPGKNDCFVKS